MSKRQATTPLSRLSLGQMSPDEALRQLQTWRVALERKMQRERAYLDHRAARHVYTPTDEAYEQDQLLEADLLVLLDELEQAVREVHT